MSAPQRPVEAPTWTAPPPVPPPSRARWVVAFAVLAAAGALVAGALLPDGGAPAASPEQPPAGVGAESPVESPADGSDAVLEELRASDRFVAFAEHERAAAAWAAGEVAFGWNNFAVVHDREVTHEWTNKAELWDEVVPPLRDELLLLGEPYTDPMWDEDNPSSATVRASWNNDSTGGRGQYIGMTGRYYDEARQTPVDLNWAVLIATHPDGSGKVVAQMPPIELVPSQATGFRQARHLVNTGAWGWVETQPVLSADDA